MGQRNSTTAKWTTDEWAFGTAENAPQLEDFFAALKELSELPFGGQAMQKDSSRMFTRGKKQKSTKKFQLMEESYFEEQQKYFDEDPKYIFAKDEKELPPIYAKVDYQNPTDSYFMIL